MQNRFSKAAAVHDLMRAVLANICKRAINVIANRILFIDLPEWSIVLIYYVDMYFRNNAGIVLRSIIQLRDLFPVLRNDGLWLVKTGHHRGDNSIWAAATAAISQICGLLLDSH